MDEWARVLGGAILAFIGSFVLYRVQAGNTDVRRMRRAREELELLNLLDEFPLARQLQRVKVADSLRDLLEPPPRRFLPVFVPSSLIMIGVAVMAPFWTTDWRLATLAWAGTAGGLFLYLLTFEKRDLKQRTRKRESLWGRRSQPTEWDELDLGDTSML